MISKYDWLNEQIDTMQAEKGLNPISYPDLDDPGEGIQMLQAAAQLKSLRPGAADPDPGFLAELRSRLLAACEESDVSPTRQGL